VNGNVGPGPKIRPGSVAMSEDIQDNVKKTPTQEKRDGAAIVESMANQKN
jgi:hypothetical protein